MANLLLPETAFRLVKRLKERVSVPIHLHTHNTSGTGAMVYFAAAMAGVDVIDCALSPLAGGTSQPATESMTASLRGTPRDTGLDRKQLRKAAAHFRTVAKRMEQDGKLTTRVLRVDPNTLHYQIPGGMLSNLLFQLKEAGAEDRLDDVLAEVPRVREDFGFPPLVTPTSQIVGTQAVLNVLLGRYQRFTAESKGLLRGEYGMLPGSVNEQVREMAIKKETPINCRPADLLSPEMDLIRKQFGEIAKREEDILSCAMFPQVAPEFIRRRDDLIVHEINVDFCP